MAEPVLRREGNWRFVSLQADGLVDDPVAIQRQVLEGLAQQAEVRPYGPLVVLFDLPPSEPDPRRWRCQIGSGVIGPACGAPPMLVEDYRGLQALCLPHYGPLSELAVCHRQLADHASSLNWLLRPYWRLALRHLRSSDGSPLIEPEVAVFVDR